MYVKSFYIFLNLLKNVSLCHERERDMIWNDLILSKYKSKFFFRSKQRYRLTDFYRDSTIFLSDKFSVDRVDQSRTAWIWDCVTLLTIC